MREGRIIKGIGGFYYIDSEEGLFECKARGIFRKNNLTPMVGDYVFFTVLDVEEKKGVIEEIKPRRNMLFRPPVANVDQVIVVFAVTQPDPNLSLLDRFLILAEKEDLDIVICFNKIDLLPLEEYQWMLDIYSRVGYKVITTSKDHPISLDDLRQALAERVSVVAGPSGVGKSSLLNHVQSNIHLQTGEVSNKTERGKHTTRHVELIPLDQKGWVVDTPGFSNLRMDFTGELQLTHYFPEFLKPSEECKFTSCLHEKEPQCGIKEAVSIGEISESRYESYLQLLEEIRGNRKY
ncbi:ribosome small subunit-dependent GTPase A [Alkaliphilus serpentinus]|uniref:Small ribosomal subunit biogenesis GTPase RsgA n=1 Tax=Alkaliphilus serpentinus TaxID=1482731 RepID=A0A833HR88_9FIRM|nr:ribosome small subunit-dependent GTPase A [Alkaliphilus serpentinus]KAB3533133.1 ribosome small subunit-dependent GTPase A [Alkaliphilus serpentinus]